MLATPPSSSWSFTATHQLTSTASQHWWHQLPTRSGNINCQSMVGNHCQPWLQHSPKIAARFCHQQLKISLSPLQLPPTANHRVMSRLANFNSYQTYGPLHYRCCLWFKNTKNLFLFPLVYYQSMQLLTREIWQLAAILVLPIDIAISVTVAGCCYNKLILPIIAKYCQSLPVIVTYCPFAIFR